MATPPGFTLGLLSPLTPIQAYPGTGMRGLNLRFQKQQAERAAKQRAAEEAGRMQRARMAQVDAYTKMFLEQQERLRQEAREAEEDYREATTSGDATRIYEEGQRLQNLPGYEPVTEEPPTAVRSGEAPSVSRQPRLSDEDKKRLTPEQYEAIGLLEAAERADPRKEREGIDKQREESQRSAQAIAQALGGAAAQQAPTDPQRSFNQQAEKTQRFLQSPYGGLIHLVPEAHAAGRQAQVRQILSPLEKEAKTPQQKEAARQAIAYGSKRATAMPANDAAKVGEEMYRFLLGESGKTRRAGMKASRMGGKDTLQHWDKIDRAYLKGIDRARQDHDIQEIEGELAGADQVLDFLRSDNPAEHRRAFDDYLKSVQGSRPSDADYKRVQEMSGAIERLKNQVKSWIAGGEFGEKFRSNFAEMIQKVKQRAALKKAYAAEQARRNVLSSPLIRNTLPPNEVKALGGDAYRQIAGMKPTEPPGRNVPSFGGGQTRSSASVTKSGPEKGDTEFTEEEMEILRQVEEE